MHVLQPTSKFNALPQRSREDEAHRTKLLELGRLIHQCGERPTAEIFAECVTLPPDIRDEMIRRLEDFTRLSPELYKATGADRFIPYLVGIPGGRHGGRSMKNAALKQIVDDFMVAVPAVITSARSHNGGACMICRAPRGTQHDDTCALWGLIDATISYRVAAEGPKTADTDRNRVEVMQLLEGGMDLSNPPAPELEFAPSATASDEWWLA